MNYPPKPVKPAYWTPARVALLVGVSGALIGVGALAAPFVAAQGDSACVDAQEWHLKQALYYSSSPEQLYHLRAAEAAQQLEAMGGSCGGWMDDAKPNSWDANGQPTDGKAVW